MSSIIRTNIFAEEKKEFASYLKATGFNKFELTTTGDGLYLILEFKTSASIMNYKLRGVEESYKATRSNVYYYDLDHSWDEEADVFFGDEDDQ